MFAIFKEILALNTDKRGVTALEYGLIAAVIAAVAAGAFGGIGTHLNTVLGTVNTAL